MMRNTSYVGLAFVTMLLLAIPPVARAATDPVIIDDQNNHGDQTGDDDSDELTIAKVYVPPAMEGVKYTNSAPFSAGLASAQSSAFSSVEGGASPYTWECSGLPSGLNLPLFQSFTDYVSYDGIGPSTFNGTPAAGTADDSPYTLTFTVTDDNGVEVTAEAVLVVLPDPEDVQADDPTIQLFGSEKLALGEMNLVVPGNKSGPWPADSPYNPANQDEDFYIGDPPLLNAVQDAEYYATGGAHVLGAAIVGGTLPYQSINVEGLPDGMTWETKSFNNGSDIENMIQIGGAPEDSASSSKNGTTFNSKVPYHVTIEVVDDDGRETSVDIGFSSIKALSITTTFFPTAFTQTAYDEGVDSTGGQGDKEWSAQGLPAGLDVVGSGNDWSVVGAPEHDVETGAYTFTLTVVDNSTSKASDSITSFLMVEEGVAFSELFAKTPTLPERVVTGQPTSIEVDHDGGVWPYTWTSSGDLPAGLELTEDATGQWAIEGTPTEPLVHDATYNISLTLTDSSSPEQSVDLEFVLTVEPALAFAAVENDSLPNAQAGESYSYEFLLVGGIAPYDFDASSVLPTLPLGLDFVTNANGNLELTGVPGLATASNDLYTVDLSVVSDDQTNGIVENADASFTLRITPAPLILGISSLSSAIIGQPYSQELPVFGGIAPFSVTASGLPAGLSVDFDEGSGKYVIDGVVAGGIAATTLVELRATDSAEPTAKKVFTKMSLSILEASETTPIALEAPELINAQEGEPYASEAITVSGGSETYIWEAPSGLPPGMSFDEFSDGSLILSGTPKSGSAGSYLIEIKVSDTSSPTKLMASAILPLSVNQAAGASSTDAQTTGTTTTIASSLVSGAAPAACSLQSGSALDWKLSVFAILATALLWRSRRARKARGL